MKKESEKQNCMACNSELINNGYNGDWKVYECSNAECSISIEKPIENPSDSGFTMESLQNLVNFKD